MMQKQLPWLRGECGQHLALVAVTDGNNGWIAFALTHPLSFTLFDNNIVSAEYHKDCFYIDNVKYQYNTLIDYKTNSSVLAYLKQQNL